MEATRLMFCRLQAQLIELMKKEAVDEAASEAIRKAEQEKAWRKREEVLGCVSC